MDQVWEGELDAATPRISRRGFLGGCGALLAAGVTAGLSGVAGAMCIDGIPDLGLSDMKLSLDLSYEEAPSLQPLRAAFASRV